MQDSKWDWDVKLTVALWDYRTTCKVTTHTTSSSLVYDTEATLPIEFEVESLRVAIDSRLTDNESLRDRFATLEALDNRCRLSAQHIKAIQQRQMIIIYQRKHNLRA